MSARFVALRPAPRSRVSAEAVADTIRADHGRVWHAVNLYGIGYRHALAIRAGWRGGGRRADPIPYRSRAWTNGRQNGWSTRPLRVITGYKREASKASA